MTNKQIVEDLKTIMDDYRTRNSGAYPMALAEAVRIIEALPEKTEGQTAGQIADELNEIIMGGFR